MAEYAIFHYNTRNDNIVGQFILELILISLPAIVASLFLGNLLLCQMVGGFMDPDSSIIPIKIP